MLNFDKSLQAWQTPAFDETLRAEIEALDVAGLPLQQGLQQGSHALGNTVRVTLLRVTDDSRSIRVKAGLFYRSIIAGCSCADDPAPVDELTEYCEITVTIDKVSAEATIDLSG
jgi:hypothetical protein